MRGWPVPGYPGLRLGHFARARLAKHWARNRPDVVHIATEGPLGTAALLAARRLGIPVSSTFHTNFHAYCRHYGAPFLRNAMLKYLRWFHNRCDVTLVPTQQLLNQLQEQGFERLQRLGRGVDRDLFHPDRRRTELRQSWACREDTPVALSVGRIAREKNLRLVIESFQCAREICPDLRLVFVGDGPLLPRLRRRFPDACYAGMRVGPDLAAHYASADLFLFPSVTETFGNVVLEALASGLVVLSYDYAAAHQFLRHEQNGFLVPYDRSDLFKAGARQLMERRASWPAWSAAARAATVEAPWRAVADVFEQALVACQSLATAAACR